MNPLSLQTVPHFHSHFRTGLHRFFSPVSSYLLLAGSRFIMIPLLWQNRIRRWFFEHSESCIWIGLALYVLVMMVAVLYVLLSYSISTSTSINPCLLKKTEFQNSQFREICEQKHNSNEKCLSLARERYQHLQQIIENWDPKQGSFHETYAESKYALFAAADPASLAMPFGRASSALGLEYARRHQYDFYFYSEIEESVGGGGGGDGGNVTEAEPSFVWKRVALLQKLIKALLETHGHEHPSPIEYIYFMDTSVIITDPMVDLDQIQETAQEFFTDAHVHDPLLYIAHDVQTGIHASSFLIRVHPDAVRLLELVIHSEPDFRNHHLHVQQALWHWIQTTEWTDRIFDVPALNVGMSHWTLGDFCAHATDEKDKTTCMQAMIEVRSLMEVMTG